MRPPLSQFSIESPNDAVPNIAAFLYYLQPFAALATEGWLARAATSVPINRCGPDGISTPSPGAEPSGHARAI